jgi:hypothetical protein
LPLFAGAGGLPASATAGAVRRPITRIRENVLVIDDFSKVMDLS